MSPVSVTSTILASIVLPMSGSSFALPGERELGDGGGGVADPRRRPPVGGDPKGLLAEDLRQVCELVEEIGQIAVARERRGHATDHRSTRTGKIGRCAPSSACPPTTSARTSSRWCGRSGSSSTPTRDVVLVLDDNSPDGTGEIADALAAGARLGRGASPARQGRNRAGVHRRVPACPRRGRRARARDRLRLLPRPGGRAAADRDVRGGHRPRARLALGRRRRHGQLGHGAEDHLARRQLLRAHDPRRPRARPHRRLQVLPPGRPRGGSTSTRSRPRATASRSRRPTGRCGPASASPRSRSRSSTGASASRRWTARSWSRRCCRCPRCAGARSAAGCRRANRLAGTGEACACLHWMHGRGHGRDVRRARCSQATCPSSSSSAPPGAGRARRSSLRSRRSPGRREPAAARQDRHRREPAHAVALRRPLRARP